MSNRLGELETILTIVNENPEHVPKETKKSFWKLVREIKRESNPDISEVQKATQIRNILFEHDRGRVYRITPFLGMQTLFGLLSVPIFIFGLTIPVNWFAIFSWGIMEIGAVIIRFIGLFLIIALFYPYGRLIAGKILGIKMDAMCFDEYHEPTLKIDYETFLLTLPSKRKWLFFFSGLWTMLTAFTAGIIGFIMAGDILGFVFGSILIIFYIYVISTGTVKHSRGEMAHFNRERRIEREVRTKLLEK